MTFQYPRGFIRHNGFRFHHLTVCVGAIALITLTGCTSTIPGAENGGEDPAQAAALSAAPPVAEPESPLDTLRTVAHDSIALYSLVKDGQWSAAQSTFDSLKASTEALKLTSTTLADLSAAQLSSGVVYLEQAIANRDREAGMREANQLVLTSASLARIEEGAELSSILMVGYYGRSLEMDVLNNSPSDFETTADELHYTWQQLRPDVAAQGGLTMAEQGDAVIAQLQAAESNADYSQVASELLALGDRLESLFDSTVSQSNP